jgi:hypothetical protein
VPTLSQTAAATRARVAPKTIKAWLEAGLISALRIGAGRGSASRFDVEMFDRQVAALPRCAYVGCDRPVAESGIGCKDHRLACEIEGKPRDTDIVKKSAATNRKHEDRDYYCEAGGCSNKLRVTKGWQIEGRRRRLAAEREDGDTRVLCGSCAADRRQREKPYTKRREWQCPTCGFREPRVPSEMHEHCRRCYNDAPGACEKKHDARLAILATPEGQAAHARALAAANGVHRASTARLKDDGRIGTTLASQLTGIPRAKLSDVLMLQPHAFATSDDAPGILRLSADPETVKALATDKRLAGAMLSKPLAVRNGHRSGRAAALTDAEFELAARLRSEKGFGWRKLAKRINDERELDQAEVSHMAVQREFERRRGLAPA